MKQSSFLLGAAVLMLATACSNDEVVKVAENSAAIGFSSFIDNATRSDKDFGSDNAPTSISVYGVSSRGTEGAYEVNPFMVFNNKEVTNSGSAWTYTPLVYWVKGNDYTFAAVAPFAATGLEVTPGTKTVGGGIESITFTNNGQVDLLYDTQNVTDAAANEDAVKFALGHMLSRVRFEFTNKMPEGYKIKVTPLAIIDAKKVGTLDPVAKTWTVADADNTTNINFVMDAAEAVADGVSKSENSYLFPATSAAYTATFEIELFLQDAKTQAYVSQKVYKHKVAINAREYKQGWSYAFKAEINNSNIDPENELYPIIFEPTVEEWIDDDKPETDVTLPKTTVNN